MPKYIVGITINAPISTVIEVEAEDEDAAIDAAHNLALYDKRYTIRDFDGNVIELLDDSIHTDSIDDVLL